MTDSAGTSTGASLPGRIAALARPAAESEGLELVDVEVRGAPGRQVVRLIADAEGGLDIDRIAALSRAVGDVVDELVDGAYTLEVTSPGLDRALRSESDFRRNVGRDVRVQRRSGADGPGELTGRVVEVDAGTLTLNVKGKATRVTLADIDHGKVVLPW